MTVSVRKMSTTLGGCARLFFFFLPRIYTADLHRGFAHLRELTQSRCMQRGLCLFVLRGQLSGDGFIFAPPRPVECLTTSMKVKLRLKAASVVVPWANLVVVVVVGK